MPMSESGEQDMKVIISTELIRFPLTGIGRYTFELVRALQQSQEVDALKMLGLTKMIEHLPSAAPVAQTSHKMKRWVQKSAFAMEAYRHIVPWLKSRALRPYQDHLYHSTNFFLPSFDGPKVATFHDLSPFTWPQCHDPAKLDYLQKSLQQTLARADRLITDSEYTRQEIAQYFGWPLERIHAVPLASSKEFYPRHEQELTGFFQSYGLSWQGYSLYVGTIEPRKNLEVLLEAYRALSLQQRQRWPLVLAGYHGWRSEPIHAKIKKAQQEGWVRYLGFVAAEDLPKLYAGARLFTFPSSYEGFGLPVLEAMSSGIPVVCSDSSSLPEVTGEAALMIAPEETQGLTELLQQGLEDEQWREHAVQRGLQQAQQFSWARCATETLAVYRRLMEEQ
ncbi:glycosyltransferase family 1 protein [Marinospirillum sp. MEB164]|uniref:Glycosyltransferase family 1 protein n=1 Tax=Marinospirillum alkalitolerans TaxID=3123374 RepID=A0ABW8PVT5_9GAMM